MRILTPRIRALRERREDPGFSHSNKRSMAIGHLSSVSARSRSAGRARPLAVRQRVGQPRVQLARLAIAAEVSQTCNRALRPARRAWGPQNPSGDRHICRATSRMDRSRGVDRSGADRSDSPPGRRSGRTRRLRRLLPVQGRPSRSFHRDVVAAGEPTVGGVRVANGPGRRGDGHTFNTFDVAGREVSALLESTRGPVDVLVIDHAGLALGMGLCLSVSMHAEQWCSDELHSSSVRSMRTARRMPSGCC
jgi:hypothetical protein